MKRNYQSGIAPLLILLILAVVVGGGVYVAKKSNGPKMGNVSTSTATSTEKGNSNMTLNVLLNEQNKSGQSGKVVITNVNGKAKVILTLSGKPSTVPEPAHIHLNNCANIGGVKYPLTSVTNGASQTMLDVSVEDLLKNLPLSINVHKSEAEISSYVACGDITTSTMGEINQSNKATTSPSKATTTATSTKATKTAEVTVSIKNFAFSPSTVVVKKGTKITWVNNDSVAHNVVSTDPESAFKSPTLQPGQSYSYTLGNEAIIDYTCTFHPSMKGRIQEQNVIIDPAN